MRSASKTPVGFRLFSAAFIFVLGIFAIPLIWGQRSGLQLFRLLRTESTLDQEIQTLTQQTNDTRQRMRDLESNPSTQIKAIRDSLGYVDPQEIVFQFVSTPHEQNRR